MNRDKQRERCRKYYWNNVEEQRKRVLSNYHKWREDPKRSQRLAEINRKAKARQRYGVEDREIILKRFNYACANCGKTPSRPMIHHIDNRGRKVDGISKPNNDSKNLMVVCPGCHLAHHRWGHELKVNR